ncbi:hypothetical protein [Streptomyces sp. bgisy032]|uniref:hypothetical protein n=1 Tax=Streptomyces sp. bgisy032 TaxID=3413773 RepID=UPI003D7041FA
MQFLTFVPFRNGEWKAHATKANVRNVIRCNAGRPLQIFALVPHAALVDEDGDRVEGTAYIEVYPPAWDDYFGEEA